VGADQDAPRKLRVDAEPLASRRLAEPRWAPAEKENGRDGKESNLTPFISLLVLE
jgi:hypothetical protein